VLALGDKGGAVGWLVGQENRGIEYMFIMMNAARYAVGLQGIGLSEFAYQQALWYARAMLAPRSSTLAAMSRNRASSRRGSSSLHRTVHIASARPISSARCSAARASSHRAPTAKSSHRRT